jgi:small subunit ribosomal protein S17
MITKQGVITSAKMQNTVTVTEHRKVAHDMYKKSFRVSKKFLADTNGVEDLMVGDEVVIQECRPISKRKHFKVTEVIKRAPRVSEMDIESAVDKAIHREKVAPDSAKASPGKPQKAEESDSSSAQ